MYALPCCDFVTTIYTMLTEYWLLRSLIFRHGSPESVCLFEHQKSLKLINRKSSVDIDYLKYCKQSFLKLCSQF